ncbi:hypothetical protein BDK51DRAFT_39081 [Blyttiomyces helicus]|uniref:Uncharacterized protein n=1 Tax=Blyttiomyces helicus TaxID=388810 RepID=A0A4P9WCW1_9FUNG|nr:hypothetical protein BDK51DRAFT_39081 [Blyttiomyces helicus]|eukprot:RKO90354.1 hypothetical protein BDK51DRAFT_39081 [Blyttiomyces helicus]
MAIPLYPTPSTSGSPTSTPLTPIATLIWGGPSNISAIAPPPRTPPATPDNHGPRSTRGPTSFYGPAGFEGPDIGDDTVLRISFIIGIAQTRSSPLHMERVAVARSDIGGWKHHEARCLLGAVGEGGESENAQRAVRSLVHNHLWEGNIAVTDSLIDQDFGASLPGRPGACRLLEPRNRARRLWVLDRQQEERPSTNENVVEEVVRVEGDAGGAAEAVYGRFDVGKAVGAWKEKEREKECKVVSAVAGKTPQLPPTFHPAPS